MNWKVSLLALFIPVAIISCKKQQHTTSSMQNQSNSEIENLIVNPLVVDNGFQVPSSNDPFTILSMKTMKDSLIVEVQYGGGCQVHEFSLFSNGMYAKSLPMQVDIHLHHVSNNDMCRALLTRRLAFDISKLKPKNSSSLNLIINGDREHQVSYNF